MDFGADCRVGGTLTASSGTTVFEGNLEAGAFVHNNGVTEFSGTEQSVTGSGTGFEFYNTTVFPGSAVTFLKNTEITGALANNGIINLSGTEGLEVYGITSGNGSISGDSGNLVFTGDCTQNSISLNSGTVSFAGNCTLTGNFTAGSGTATFGKDCSVGGIFSASTSVTVFRGNLEAGAFEHNNGGTWKPVPLSIITEGWNFPELYKTLQTQEPGAVWILTKFLSLPVLMFWHFWI